MQNASSKFLLCQLPREHIVSNGHISLLGPLVHPNHTILELYDKMLKNISNILTLFVIHSPITSNRLYFNLADVSISGSLLFSTTAINIVEYTSNIKFIL